MSMTPLHSDVATNGTLVILTVSTDGAGVLAAHGPDATKPHHDALLTRAVQCCGESPARVGTIVVDTVAGQRVALVGVGELQAYGSLDPDNVRVAAATATRARAAADVVTWPVRSTGAEIEARAAIEGIMLGGHERRRWSSDEVRIPPRAEVSLDALDDAARGEVEAIVADTRVVTRWVNHARVLVDTPASHADPAGLVRLASELLADVDVDIEVHDAAAIRELGLTAYLAVAGTSRNEPQLLVVRRRGRGPTLGLVGKAVTFDAGGLFLKPRTELVRQHADMGGAAAVLCAMGAIAELGIDADIIAIIPACENMPGGSLRPGDVVTTADGLHIEVDNPDAEGRLTLADGMHLARRLGAERLVDVATLTGAMRAAMGDTHAGAFTNDESWRDQVLAAGDRSGDAVWPWPPHDRFRELLRSDRADIRTSTGRDYGYALAAAAFLEHFSGGMPWVHVDMLSTVLVDAPLGPLAPGATGWGVRMLVELAASTSRDDD